MTLFGGAAPTADNRFQARQDSNLQHPVLETGALPLELLAFGCTGRLRPDSAGPPSDRGLPGAAIARLRADLT